MRSSNGPGSTSGPRSCRENQSRAIGLDVRVRGARRAGVQAAGAHRAAGRGRGLLGQAGRALRAPTRGQAPIVATGHQPDLYHPGVWAKDFLLERLAREVGADAVDIVVDSDGFDSVAVTSPCMQPGIGRCRQYLAVGATDTAYAFAPVPDDEALAEFCASGDAMLATLPAPAVARHFAAFCDVLRGSAPDSDNLAELITIARRRYEASARHGLPRSAAHAPRTYSSLPTLRVRHRARCGAFRRRLQRGARPVPSDRQDAQPRAAVPKPRDRRRCALSCRFGTWLDTVGRACGRSHAAMVGRRCSPAASR